MSAPLPLPCKPCEGRDHEHCERGQLIGEFGRMACGCPSTAHVGYSATGKRMQPIDRRIYNGIRKGDELCSPKGARWRVTLRWTRGHGGEVWTAIKSEGGRIRHVLAYELEGWYA